MLVYTESPINGTITSGGAFMINAQDQYQELVRQTYDNPSVFAWGFGNETTSSADGIKVFTQFNTIAHTLDSSCKTGFAQYGGSTSTSKNLDGISDIKGTHRYDGWYSAATGVKGVNDTFDAYKSQPLGITEVGARGSAYQYADSFTLPVSSQAGGVTTHFHPENQQSAIEELQMTQYASLNYLWARIVWQSFDHASSGKNEGNQGGINNDKGLTTRDRTPKNAYYFLLRAVERSDPQLREPQGRLRLGSLLDGSERRDDDDHGLFECRRAHAVAQRHVEGRDDAAGYQHARRQRDRRRHVVPTSPATIVRVASNPTLFNDVFASSSATSNATMWEQQNNALFGTGAFPTNGLILLGSLTRQTAASPRQTTSYTVGDYSAQTAQIVTYDGAQALDPLVAAYTFTVATTLEPTSGGIALAARALLIRRRRRQKTRSVG